LKEIKKGEIHTMENNTFYILQWVFGVISMFFFAMLPLIVWYRIENKIFEPGSRAYNAAQLASAIFFIIGIVGLIIDFTKSKK
jgi:hypothetical protein